MRDRPILVPVRTGNPLQRARKKQRPLLPSYRQSWLDRAEEARRAAERLADPDAKQVMLHFSQLYLHLAQADADKPAAEDTKPVPAARLN
ncbi:MAG: hypothetical protein WA633_24890 [Stellaceae bacterium]